MGLATKAQLAQVMLERGWKASTPAAIAFAASTARSQTWLGTLGELGRASIPDELIGDPATLCIGEVVSLSARLAQAPGLRRVRAS
jgi:siroheme synthase